MYKIELAINNRIQCTYTFVRRIDLNRKENEEPFGRDGYVYCLFIVKVTNTNVKMFLHLLN